MAKRQRKRVGKRAYLKKSWRGIDPTNLGQYVGSVKSMGQWWGMLPDVQPISQERALVLARAKEVQDGPRQAHSLWQSDFWQGLEKYAHEEVSRGKKFRITMYFTNNKYFFIKETMQPATCMELSTVYISRARAMDVLLLGQIIWKDRMFPSAVTKIAPASAPHPS